MDHYELGKLAFQQGDFSEARDHLEQAGEDGRALLLLGQMASNGNGQPKSPARAAELYRAAAELGSAGAAFNLGALHALGRGVLPDQAAALRWYEKAAELGDAEAYRIVGVMYANGRGVPRDLDKAEQAWRTAAERGQQKAFADLGRFYSTDRRDLAEAADWLLKSAGSGNQESVQELLRLIPELRAQAEAGDTRSRTMLGVIHMLYVDDPQETVALLTRSSDEGDAVARRTLAFVLEQGQGVPADPARAVELYRSAAEAGDAIAAFNMGIHHIKGEVVKADVHESIKWLRIAATAGIPESYAFLGNQLSSLDQDEEALRWYLAGAEAGQPNLMYVAGMWFKDGIGTSADLVQSLRWFLAMLTAGSGDGLHEAHQIAGRMTPEQIREAARLAGRPLDAEIFLEQRGEQ